MTAGLAAIEARDGGAGRAAAAFRAAVREERLGQTYLIYGPTGAGKMELARAIGAAAACVDGAREGDACGRCAACAAGTSGAEADLGHLAPAEGKREILIDQVRDASRDLSLAPLVGRARVLIVEQADRLREEAANAFLKTLEEPPERAVVLLLTARPEAVLPTIRSRALEVRLPPRGAAAGPPELVLAAARALVDDEEGGDPFERAGRAAAAIERAAAESEAEGAAGARQERLRRAALVALDAAAGRVRERFRERALAGRPILRDESAVRGIGLAAERIEANATPRLVLEVLSIELDRARGGRGGADVPPRTRRACS